jgi:hypothetical protein
MALETPDATKMVTITQPIGGFLFDAPLGTVVNPDPNSPLPEGVRCLGYLDADAGFVEADNAEDGTDKVVLGGDVVGTTPGINKPTVAFSLVEIEAEAAANMAYGPGEVTYDDATKVLRITDKGGKPEPRMLILQTVINATRVGRKIWEKVDFASRGDRTISNGTDPSFALVYNVRKVAGINSDYISAPVDAEPIV